MTRCIVKGSLHSARLGGGCLYVLMIVSCMNVQCMACSSPYVSWKEGEGEGGLHGKKEKDKAGLDNTPQTS
jgi:hypothetical protein